MTASMSRVDALRSAPSPPERWQASQVASLKTANPSICGLAGVDVVVVGAVVVVSVDASVGTVVGPE